MTSALATVDPSNSLLTASDRLTLSYVADDRVSVTVRLTREGLDLVRAVALDASTPEHRVTVSDVIRVALKHGLPAAKKELRKR